MLEKEVKNIDQQNTSLTKENLELLKCITETLSNIKIIMKAEEEKELKENDPAMYENLMSRAQRRDSMGRYMDYGPRYMMAPDMMSMDNGGGNSYARGNSNNSYENSNARNSRDYNSYSRDDSRKKMVRKLETLMDDTMSDKERQAIQDCINRIDQ